MLLIYSEATNNPDFHMACGMVYLLMSQDSDDKELLTLAYREFMMHLRDHPSCDAAYRNLLATVMLRREPSAIMECCAWIKGRGKDVEAMLDELAEAGVELFSDDSKFLYIEGLYRPGEFGAIDVDCSAQANEENSDDDSATNAEKSTKVIKFRGAANCDESTTANGVAENANRHGGYPFKGTEENSAEDVYDLISQLLTAENESDDEDQIDADEDDRYMLDGLIAKDAETEKLPAELRARVILRSAEQYCERGQLEKALDVLNRITPSDGYLYYSAECVRAFILLENDRVGEAQAAISRALDSNPSGALAGTLLCTVYELQGKFELIPQALKNIAVGDFVDADHVYKAMRLAIKYCDPIDALDLAEEYIDEYNVMDIRQLYAQMLYNNGEREDAVHELYLLTRIFYDDFNAQYYYLTARTGDAVTLPIDEEAPQPALSQAVEKLTSVVQSGSIDDRLIESDAFNYGLELYLTLEYQNERKVLTTMFDTLRKLAADTRLESKMRDAIVSPYVEPIVKAVILSELLKRNASFLVDLSYRPMSDDSVPTLGDGFSAGYYTAYAFVLMFDRHAIKTFIKCANDLRRWEKENGSLGGDADTAERDAANYLIRRVRQQARRGSKRGDPRIDYALGYTTKPAASKAYKAFAERFDKQNTLKGDLL